MGAIDAMSIINGLGSIVSAPIQEHYNLELMKKQNEYNKQAVERQVAAQKEMYEYTGYASKVRQLKEAGLNPGLVYGMGGTGGATTGNTTAAQVSQPGAPNVAQSISNLNQIMGLMLQSQKQPVEINNIIADTEKKKSEGSIAKTQAEINEEVKEYSKIQKKAESDTAQENLGKAISEKDIANINANVARATEQTQIDQKVASLLKTNAETTLTQEQANSVVQSVLQNWARIGNDTTKIENELSLRLKEMNVQMNIAWIHAAAQMLSKAIPSTSFIKSKSEGYIEKYIIND